MRGQRSAFAKMETSFTGGTTLGQTVTGSATPDVKGSWSSTLLTPSFDVYSIMVVWQDIAGSADDTSVLLDIGDGTNVFIPNILAGFASSGSWAEVFGPVPLFIPSGTNIQARLQGDNASETADVGVYVWGEPIGDRPWTASGIEALGANTGDSGGVAVTAGVSGAEGSWASLGSTDSGKDGFGVLMRGTLSAVTAASGRILRVDLGLGSTPDLIIPDQAQLTISTEISIWMPLPPLMLQIPRGTQLQARASQNASTAEVIDVVAYILQG